MPDRPSPRRTRVIVTWDGVRYEYRTLDEGGRPIPEPGTVAARYPLVELAGARAPARSGGAMYAPRSDPVGSGPSIAGEGNASPGLYDLPTLLARIWSVPAAQRAGGVPFRPPTGGSDSPSPPPPRGPGGTVEGVLPAFTVAEWTVPTPGADLSLPLAAVPSLRIAPPPLADRLPPEPARSTVDGPGPIAAGQYVAWRHPPCHLPYDLPHPHDRSNVRGLAGEVTSRPRDGPHDGWARRNMWMRLASPAAAVGRYPESVAADG